MDYDHSPMWGLRRAAVYTDGSSAHEFVICAAWTSSSEQSEAEDAFEPGDEHSYLPAKPHRAFVFLGFGPSHAF